MQKEKIDPEHTLKPIFHPNRNNFVKQPNTKFAEAAAQRPGSGSKQLGAIVMATHY